MMLKLIPRKLLNYLSSLKFFNNKDSFPKIPKTIYDEEKIIRSIFSPINVDKSNKLRANAFKSPPNIDEVSVNRLNHTTSDFCKRLSKKIENPENNRLYFGLALLIANVIRTLKAEVVSSPIEEPKEMFNPYHADIKIGFAYRPGDQLPAEFNYKIQKLADSAIFHIDPNPSSSNWEGDEL